MNRTYLVTLSAVLVFSTAEMARAQPWPPGIDSSIGLQRSRLGIHVQPMTEELREHFHAPRDRGVLVSQVEAGKPAAASGVEVGDIILSADGTPIERPFDLVRSVARTPEGESLELVLIRDEEQQTVAVRPEGEATPWIDPSYWQEWAERGLRMGSEELRNQLHELDRRLRELEEQLDELKKESEKKDGQRT
jgi:C-terminal processing protease CtpA/Prc